LKKKRVIIKNNEKKIIIFKSVFSEDGLKAGVNVAFFIF